MSVRGKLLVSAFGLLLVFLTGTIGYSLIEGWSLFDSFYMTMITVTTVGFGEVHNLDPAGRFLTVVLIVSGLTVGAYGLTNLTTYFVGGQIMETLRGRRMERMIQNLRNHVIVAGFGKLGREIAQELNEAGADFCIIEQEDDKVENARQKGYLVVEGDASDDEILLQAGVDRAYGLVTALTGDAGNVMVTITARELNPNLLIVARGIDEYSEAKLRRAGADRVELPFKISGRRLTTLVLKPGFVEFIDLFSRTFSEDLHMEQVIVPAESKMVNRSIGELDIRRVTGGLLIMAIERASGKLMMHPAGEVIIEPEDRILVLGNETQIGKFQNVFNLQNK